MSARPQITCADGDVTTALVTSDASAREETYEPVGSESVVGIGDGNSNWM